jgi:hypothetical protein
MPLASPGTQNMRFGEFGRVVIGGSQQKPNPVSRVEVVTERFNVFLSNPLEKVKRWINTEEFVNCSRLSQKLRRPKQQQPGRISNCVYRRLVASV